MICINNIINIAGSMAKRKKRAYCGGVAEKSYEKSVVA